MTASTAVSTAAKAVMIITGMAGLISLIRTRASRPEIFSIRISMRIRSKAASRTASMAVAPSSASLTAYPHPDSRVRSMVRWARSSSTTRIEFFAFIGICHLGFKIDAPVKKSQMALRFKGREGGGDGFCIANINNYPIPLLTSPLKGEA